MKISAHCLALCTLLLLSAPPALAADAPADPASALGKAGQVILDAVAGRSYAAAFKRTHSPANPFDIDLDALAAAAGVASVSGGTTGEVAADRQLSILPQFNTPQQKFAASPQTPAVIPFAFMLGGVCYGGYASGFPAAEKIFAADMAGRECSALAVDKAVGEHYPLAIGEVAPAAAAPAKTDDSAAKPDAADSADVAKVGQVILGAVDGRTLEQALDATGDDDNPFGLDADPLLLAAGVYFVSTDSTGAAIEKSEFSIYSDYVTPGDKFQPSEKTPPVMPFAFNRGGTCFGGYVTGFPVPDKVIAVDMASKVCNAKTIDDIIDAQYHLIASERPAAAVDQGAPADGAAPSPDAGDSTESAAPPDANGSATPADTATPAPDNTLFDGTSATDHDLEMIVYGAYTGAYNQATKHGNYFTSPDFPFAALRSAIRDALAKEGYGETEVVADPLGDATAARACATDGHVQLRVAFNNDGTGLSLAAVSDKRMSAYEYDPGTSSQLAIVPPADCASAGKGAAPDGLSAPTH